MNKLKFEFHNIKGEAEGIPAVLIFEILVFFTIITIAFKV